MIKILITGGLGHIGSYLIRSFDSRYNITVVDDMLTQRYCSLFNLGRKIHFIESGFADISEEEVKRHDVVIHLAAVTNAATSFKNAAIESVNIIQTKQFVELCKDKVRLFVFPSSTSVYGTSDTIMYEDDYNNILPQSPYAESKIIIEEYIRQSLTGSRTSYLILRLGTIFGNSIGMRFHTAINKFIYDGVLGRDLTVWRENYNQYRPYLGLNDARRSIELLLNKEESHNNTYNVLSDNVRLDEIVEYIVQRTGAQVKFVDTPLLNQNTYTVSYDKIRMLGYEPHDNLFSNIDQTIKMLSGVYHD